MSAGWLWTLAAIAATLVFSGGFFLGTIWATRGPLVVIDWKEHGDGNQAGD